MTRCRPNSQCVSAFGPHSRALRREESQTRPARRAFIRTNDRQLHVVRVWPCFIRACPATGEFGDVANLVDGFDQSGDAPIEDKTAAATTPVSPVDDRRRTPSTKIVIATVSWAGPSSIARFYWTLTSLAIVAPNWGSSYAPRSVTRRSSFLRRAA
jgi:hypothetical protein